MSQVSSDTINQDEVPPKVVSGGSRIRKPKFKKVTALVFALIIAGLGAYLVHRSFAQSTITNPYSCPPVNGIYPEIKVGTKDGSTGINGEKCVSAVQWDMILSQNNHHFDKNNQYPVKVTGTYSNTDKQNAILMQTYFNWWNKSGEWSSDNLAVFNAFVPFKPLDNTTTTTATNYDQAILADKPVGYWTLGEGSGTATDSSTNKVNGTYKGTSSKTTLPNGDSATDFPGEKGTYVEIPDKDQYSVSTTKYLTWEAWIRPDTLTSGYDNNYSNFLGKCTRYNPTCEWEGRMYDTKTPAEGENRCNRVSAYIFNLGADLGSAGDWQPKCGLAQANQWLHVVGQYQIANTPSSYQCNSKDYPASKYPGTIDIWVNGVKWSQSSHADTGCMNQYGIQPQNSTSPVTVGTMALTEYWFKGAVGKFAIYDHPLTQAQISAHYQLMTGHAPSGSCANNCTLNY